MCVGVGVHAHMVRLLTREIELIPSSIVISRVKRIKGGGRTVSWVLYVKRSSSQVKGRPDF